MGASGRCHQRHLGCISPLQCAQAWWVGCEAAKAVHGHSSKQYLHLRILDSRHGFHSLQFHPLPSGLPINPLARPAHTACHH